MSNKTIKKGVYNLMVLVLVIGGLGYVASRFIHLGRVEFTDNAHVKQHITPINTRVAGFIKRVCFEEFEPVKRGDTLVIIEDTEYRLRLAQAEADYANATAGQAITHAGIATTENNLTVNDATITETRAQLELAQRELQRYEQLLKEDAVTQQQYDNVHTAYLTAKARFEQVMRTKQTTSLIKNEQTNRLGQNAAGVRLAKAAVELAQLNLGYTVIVATCDGVMGRKEIREGELVQPGQTLANIVDNSDLWVVANYRETQLPHIHPGAQAVIRADAVPGVTFKGEVERIADATGSAFSLIPQDNATGNFVKVEQRVPVRIRLKGNRREDLALLRAGLNVECEINYEKE